MGLSIAHSPNLECHSITVGGVEDHIHVLCNLTNKQAPMKVLEVLKKDSSKFAKTLNPSLASFHWQDGYGLFSISPAHREAAHNYILNQEHSITRRKLFRKNTCASSRNTGSNTTNAICGISAPGQISLTGMPFQGE